MASPVPIAPPAKPQPPAKSNSARKARDNTAPFDDALSEATKPSARRQPETKKTPAAEKPEAAKKTARQTKAAKKNSSDQTNDADARTPDTVCAQPPEAETVEPAIAEAETTDVPVGPTEVHPDEQFGAQTASTATEVTAQVLQNVAASADQASPTAPEASNAGDKTGNDTEAPKNTAVAAPPHPGRSEPARKAPATKAEPAAPQQQPVAVQKMTDADEEQPVPIQASDVEQPAQSLDATERAEQNDSRLQAPDPAELPGADAVKHPQATFKVPKPEALVEDDAVRPRANQPTTKPQSPSSPPSPAQPLDLTLPEMPFEIPGEKPAASSDRPIIQLGEATALLSSDSGKASAPASHASSASQPAPPPTPPEQQFAVDNHPKIITGVRSTLLPNGGTMQIRLDPPELGDLQISINLRDGVMTASFQTSNDEATRLLSHSLGQLKGVLESQGVSVDKLHVQQAPRNESSNSSNSDDRQHQQGHAHDSPARREQERRELLRRMWRRLTEGSDPLDMVA
jgi:flagellar hook-length control protein FliK